MLQILNREKDQHFGNACPIRHQHCVATDQATLSYFHGASGSSLREHASQRSCVSEFSVMHINHKCHPNVQCTRTDTRSMCDTMRAVLMLSVVLCNPFMAAAVESERMNARAGKQIPFQCFAIICLQPVVVSVGCYFIRFFYFRFLVSFFFRRVEQEHKK